MQSLELVAAFVSSDWVRSHGVTVDPGPNGFAVNAKGNLMASGKIVELTEEQKRKMSPYLQQLVDPNF